LEAEGFPNFQGYVKPLYLLPLFQKRIAIGANGFPFNISTESRYDKGVCPVCERMYEKELILFEPCAFDVSEETATLLVEALRKVHKNSKDLKYFEE
jgi:hypothetical protein